MTIPPPLVSMTVKELVTANDARKIARFRAQVRAEQRLRRIEKRLRKVERRTRRAK